MSQIASTLSHWLNSHLWSVLLVCVVLYLVITVRFLAHWILQYRVKHWSDLPMEIPVPVDVYLGIGISIFVACSSITLSVLLEYPTISAGFMVAAIDVFLLFCAVAPISMPLRFYKKARRRMEIESSSQHNRSS